MFYQPPGPRFSLSKSEASSEKSQELSVRKDYPLCAACGRGAWVPAAADVLAATDGGGALAAFFNSSKGAFERTRDEFFVCAGCCAASGSSRCSLRATSYDDHGVYVLRSTHLARSVPCAH